MSGFPEEPVAVCVCVCVWGGVDSCVPFSSSPHCQEVPAPRCRASSSDCTQLGGGGQRGRGEGGKGQRALVRCPP